MKFQVLSVSLSQDCNFSCSAWLSNNRQIQTSTLEMRLQFQLNKINISPICHIQLAHHADQARGRHAAGALFGALYDDDAHVTNILPYPETDSREQIDAMERRHEDLIDKFGMDRVNLGWYVVSQKSSFWDELENIYLSQKINNTNFFLIFDYEAREIGKSPYKAYRLADKFALQKQFDITTLADIEPTDLLVQIPVVIQKNQIFEALMLFSKKNLMKDFIGNRKNTKKDNLKNKVDQYIQALEEQAESLQTVTEKKAKDMKNVPLSQYAKKVGVVLKAAQQQKNVRGYQQNIIEVKKILENC